MLRKPFGGRVDTVRNAEVEGSIPFRSIGSSVITPADVNSQHETDPPGSDAISGHRLRAGVAIDLLSGCAVR